MGNNTNKILYQGHGSLRITTKEGKIIYIDPFAGSGYDTPADLILITHNHSDHTDISKIKNRNPDCQIISWKEALVQGKHKTFNFDYITVESVEAGYNRNHDVNNCVGFVITFSDETTVYISGDTSKTKQMASLAEKNLDYAFFCCDGVYNMDINEAIECAKIVSAKHSIPYHMSPGKLFDLSCAEKFDVNGKMIVSPGDEIPLL